MTTEKTVQPTCEQLIGEAKHTPGPWTYDPTTDPNADIVSAYGLVARTTGHQTNQQDNEGRANARLIAAAPDLLASCQEFAAELDYMDLDVPIVFFQAMTDRLVTAIAKAEG